MTLSLSARKRQAGLSGFIRQQLMRIRLMHIILGAVLWSLVLTELAVLTPAMFTWNREELQRLQQETLQLLKANVDITSFPSVADTIKVGERLGSFAAVRGGVVVNVLGDELGSFGQRPALPYLAAVRDGVSEVLTADRAHLDVLYPVEKTGLAYPLILRLDATKVGDAVLARIKDKAQSSLGVALVSGVIVALVLSIFIVRPAIKLRDVAIEAADNPDRADKYRLRWRRPDELGDVARAFDMLLTAVSIVHQEDLAVSKEAIERSSHAMMNYDPSGRLIQANPAAMRLFGVMNIEELARQPADFLRMKTHSGSIDISPMDLLKRGDINQMCEVITPNGLSHCHVSATTLKRKNGAVLRHAVSLVDVSSYVAEVERAEEETDRVSAANGALRRRVCELKGMFESCLVILGNTQAAPVKPGAQPTGDVLTERVVNTWHNEAHDNGLVRGRLEHGALPPVRGAKDLVEAAFRQAMLLVYTRSNAERASISVRAYVLQNGMARFEIFETNDDGQSEERAEGHGLEAGAPIAMMALGQTLARLGGQLIPAEPDRNKIAFLMHMSDGPSLQSLADGIEDAPRAKRERRA